MLQNFAKRLKNKIWHKKPGAAFLEDSSFMFIIKCVDIFA
jgi:hypothetical protein